MLDQPTEIACQQILEQDASVFSIQWMDLPPRHGRQLNPDLLLQRYLEHIRRFTCGLVRPAAQDGDLVFRLWITPWSLLRFIREDQNGQTKQTLALRICGGLLVQRDFCDRGELVFICRPEGENTRVVLQLADYCPLLLGGPRPHRLRKWLYRFTQAAIHKIVTVRFLQRLYRELAGPRACCRVVRVQVREGEAI